MAHHSDGPEGEALTINLAGRAALLSVAGLAILGLFAFGIALPRLAQHFAGQPNVVLLSQLVGGVVSLAFAAGSPIAGKLIDRFGYKSVLISSCIAYGIVGSVGGLFDNLYLILLTRILLGLTIAGALVGSLAGIGLLGAKDRARMFGFQALFGALLSMGAYPVVGWLSSIDWRLPFALHLLAFLIIPLTAALPQGRRAAGLATAGAATRKEMRVGLPLTLLLLAAFMGMMSIAAPLFAPFFLLQIGVTSTVMQSIPLVAMGPAAILATAVFGWLHERLGGVGVFILALATAGVGFIIGGLSHSVAQLAVALFIASAGLALSAPNLSATAVNIVKQNPGGALGLVNGVLYGAQVLFPFVGTAISKTAGPAAVFEGFGIVSVLLAAVYGLSGLRPRRVVPS